MSNLPPPAPGEPSFTFAESGKYTIGTTQSTLNMKTDYNLKFHGDGGKVIGTLDFNGDAMKFTGEAEESAKVFIDWICTQFHGRLEQERIAVRAKPSYATESDDRRMKEVPTAPMPLTETTVHDFKWTGSEKRDTTNADIEAMLGAFAAEALQGDFSGVREWARSVKIEMRDGEPIVRIAAESAIEAPNEAQEALRTRILAERDKGNIVFWGLENELMAANLDEFVKQPADGILYDLNRSEEISLTFIADKKWVNDFAVALVIRKLAAKASPPEEASQWTPGKAEFVSAYEMSAPGATVWFMSADGEVWKYELPELPSPPYMNSVRK